MPVSNDRYSDDIDLLNLVERSISFFKRYRWIFIIAIILGLSTGFYLYKSIPGTYKSKMLVHSFLLSNQEEIQILRNWNQLLGKKEFTALAADLDMEESLLHKVKKIKAEEIQQVFSPVNPHGFTVEVTVTDTSVLDELERGIVYGFENSIYVRERLQSNRAGMLELIATTESQIRQLDSTKNMIENILSGRGRSSSTLIIDGSINTRIVEMNEKLIGLKSQLQFSKAVQVLHGFSKFSKRSDPKLLPLLIIGLLLFLTLGYIVALLSSVNASLRQRAMNRKSQP